MKKMLSLILAVLMLTSFAACAGESADNTANDTTAQDTGTTAETTTAVQYEAPEVNDYEGYEYRIGINDSRNKNASIIIAEEANGEAFNDAVYERNEKISELYNIKIKGLVAESNSIVTKMQTAVLAGDDLYDVAAMGMRQHFPLAQEGMFHELNSLDCIDFSQPWWDESILEAFEVKGKNYTVVGDYLTSDDVFILILLFNSKLYTDLGFEDPYEMVFGGNWVFDRFMEMAMSGSVDLNGDGNMDKNDRWGLLSEASAYYYFSTGAGFMPLDRDSKGDLSYNIDSERNFNIFEKVKKFSHDRSICILASDITDFSPYSTVWLLCDNMFIENQALFKSCCFNDIVNYRTMEMDFGVLPVPKFDESQEEYANLVTNHSDALVFPVTVSDIERTMNITDAIGYESMLSLSPCFYEVFLDEKLVRDENSKAMIDIILDTKKFDLEWTANISGFVDVLIKLAQSRNDNLASEWAAISGSAASKLEAFIAKFED